MNKKTLLIIGFVILVVALGVLIYFVFIKDLVNPQNGNANENVNGTTNQNFNGCLPNINGVDNTNRIQVNTNQGLNFNSGQQANINGVKVDDVARGGQTFAKEELTQKTEAVSLSSDGNLRYYDPTQGKFYKLDSNGKPQELSDKTFPDAKKITWSPKGDKAVVSFPDQSQIVYDFDKKQQVTLPKTWSDVTFSPTGDELGFMNVSEQEDSRWLAVSNTDASEVQLVEPLGDNASKVDVNWSPSGQVVALFTDSANATAQTILPIGLHQENFKSFDVLGRGFQGIWSPIGDQILYSIYSDGSRYNPVVHLVDASGDATGYNNINLNLQTWASKCTYNQAGDFAFCAVPQYLPTGSALEPALAGYTNDRIYMIDVNTGISSLIALPTYLSQMSQYVINAVFVSQDGMTLYFTEDVTGGVYSIKLR
ncbi:MAG: hypothetical protein WC544_02780 [Patescibacteria group bacterium]